MEAMETTEVIGTHLPGNLSHRLVHLDLKGAPPKICYYEELFPLLHKWGATGLLVEYEDMFPFSGSYKDIAASNCYSVEEIQQLQWLAENNNLIVIPLVQSFGHFEYVLKNDKFHKLREIPEYPMALCPLHAESVQTVTDMIDQVIKLHPNLRWFHIGADEVFHVGMCERCRKHMTTTNLTQMHLFFMHIKIVLEHIHSKHPSIRPIMWDDMFREADLDLLKASGITDLVDPMVWLYTKGPFKLPEDLWERYSTIFDNLWVASAFKGATGPCMYVTDIGYHIENNIEWITTTNAEIMPKFKKFQGYCLTGWQRYDHFCVLCELLPVALPSLAVCLLTINQGSFTEDVHRQASLDLKFTDPVPLNPFRNIDIIAQCQFPGSDVFTNIQVLLLLKTDFNNFMETDRFKGWMSPYHVRQNVCNPVHIQHFLPGIKLLLHNFHDLESNLQESLSKVFHTDTVEEWICCNVTPCIEQLTKIVTDGDRLLQAAQPKPN